MGLLLSRNNWGKRYVVVTDSTVSALHGKKVLNTLREMEIRTDLITFPQGESFKTMETCLSITKKLLELGIDRTSALLALGGGVVGDITGFVASIFMRGIPCIQIPTTLLAQVDSAIGGKTGIDISEGKNLIGTFWQPKEVFIDTSFLETLPQKEFTNGLAEIIKYGLIDDPVVIEIFERDYAKVISKDHNLLLELIRKSCIIKKRIVELDETEKGLRRILNFGHTLGHALEAESDYALSHGEAIAAGMTGAAYLSEELGYLQPCERERIESAIEKSGLPIHIPKNFNTEALLLRMKHDKKKEGDSIHFVLLKAIGLPFVNGGVPISLVEKTIERLKG